MRSWPKVIVLVGCLALAGCGIAANKRDLGVGGLPLPSGAKITTQVRICDRGANAYCSEQLVVTGAGYSSSAALFDSLNHELTHKGWTVSRGLTGKQLAAQSPGNELRLTFATAYNDLLAIDSNWIHRSAPIGHALSAAIFSRRPALSLMLERGSS